MNRLTSKHIHQKMGIVHKLVLTVTLMFSAPEQILVIYIAFRNFLFIFIKINSTNVAVKLVINVYRLTQNRQGCKLDAPEENLRWIILRS